MATRATVDGFSTRVEFLKDKIRDLNPEVTITDEYIGNVSACGMVDNRFYRVVICHQNGKQIEIAYEHTTVSGLQRLYERLVLVMKTLELAKSV